MRYPGKIYTLDFVPKEEPRVLPPESFELEVQQREEVYYNVGDKCVCRFAAAGEAYEVPMVCVRTDHFMAYFESYGEAVVLRQGPQSPPLALEEDKND